MLLTRELKSAVLCLLVLFVVDANAAPNADKPKNSNQDKKQIRIPLDVKTTCFIYSNPKLMKKYVESRLTSEIEQLKKEKSKLKGAAKKQVVNRWKKLKRELVFWKKKNIVPESLKKKVTDFGIGFVTGKPSRWVRVVRIINDKEFVATIGYQRVTARVTSRNYGKAITPGTFAGFNRKNIEGSTPFRFIGFDTSKVRVNNVYRLQGFFKTTTKTVEPFVPDDEKSRRGGGER